MSPHIEIPLRSRDGNVRAIALIDAADAHLAAHRWFLSAGYAVRTVQRDGKRTTFCLHREVLQVSGSSTHVDHISGDPLDCRRANLRCATRAENQQNRPAQKGTSRYRNVSYHANEQAWRARVQLDGKHHHLGYFKTEEQAAEAARRFREENMPFANEQRSVVAVG
jgi:hypothetical protein